MFSLVFLTWNAEDVIAKTLDTVVAQTFDDFEVIIVDNASADDTVEIVQSQYSDKIAIQVYQNETNLGFTEGTNRGIEYASGQYICCYNHDTQFPPDYLEILSNNVTQNAVYTTARENHRVSKKHECVRMLGWQRYAVPYVVDSLTGTAQVNFVPGDGVIIPRSVYEDVLHESVYELPGRGEDVDLSLRLMNDNIPLVAILDTFSIHPDVGMYQPTVANLEEHLRHAKMRFTAFLRNDGEFIDLLAIILSIFSIPIIIYMRKFPRDTDQFNERQQKLS